MLARKAIGLRLLLHKMNGKGGNQPYFLGFLFGFCLPVFPGSNACPKLCACYVPAEVHCTFRYLTKIPLHISRNVERINLGYNNLVNLTETDFSGLEKLELLMLHSNQIHTIQDKTFSDLHLLQVLKMSYNKIKIINADTFHGLITLVRLHMDHNQIEFVNPKAFYTLTSLKLVHLEGNLLKHLHPDTFVTFCYLQLFRTSTIKHLFLSDNFLTSLPQDIFLYMSELESLYLNGNPWTCDCSLKWFAEWAERHPDIVKCKKSRGASGVLQCPLCANPTNTKGKPVTQVPPSSFNCVKPTIDTALKLKNITVPYDGDLTLFSPKDFMAPIGSVTLNMTDQAGNQANLACNVQKPSKMSPVVFKKNDSNTILEISLTTFLVCNIDTEHIHQPWRILALYSNSPLKLAREHLLTEMPYISYRYKQVDSKNEELFTGIESELTAEPSWLLQGQVSMKLDRTATTLNSLHIRYSIDAHVILPDDAPKPTRQKWAMILRGNNTRMEHNILVGGSVELDCRALGDPIPVIVWWLADGSKVKAPYISEDRRILIAKSGKLLLHSADHFDTGVYHCIGTNYDDADVLTFRITVIGPVLEQNYLNGPQLSVFLGESIYLPCLSKSAPDASINWVTPENTILHSSLKDKVIFYNGTLKIHRTTEQDSGYFMCILANKYGVDFLVYQVLVKRNSNSSQKLDIHSETAEGSGNIRYDFIGQFSNLSSAIPTQITVQTSTQDLFSNYSIPNKAKGNIKENHRLNRSKINRRLRGRKRQFGLSTKRIDPLYWAAFLGKTKNSTLLRKQEKVPVKPTVKVFLSSKISGNEEETSGDDIFPEEEFIFLATKRPTKSTLREASGNVATAELESMVMHSEMPQDQKLQNKTKAEMKRVGFQRYQTLPTPLIHLETKMHSSFKEPNNTATSLNILQGSMSSIENNLHFKSTPTVTQKMNITNKSNQFIISHITAKPDLFAEAIEKTPKKSSHQPPLVTASVLDDVDRHYNAQKLIPPLSAGSVNIIPQQLEIADDSTTRSPLRGWYGSRRKISGKQRMLRPGHSPSIAGHRLSFARPGFASENSSLSFPADMDIPIVTPSTIPLESVITQAPVHTSVILPYPKGTIVNQIMTSSVNKLDSVEGSTTFTTVPFYPKSTQIASKRVIESTSQLQAISDIDLEVNIYVPTANPTVHNPMLTTEMAVTKANRSTFMINSTISSSGINVSNSASPGQIPWRNFFGSSYVPKEVGQKQPILEIEREPSSEVSVTSSQTMPTYRNSSIYETAVSKKDFQTEVPNNLIKPISDNVLPVKHDPTLSFIESSYIYNFTTFPKKENDATTIQLTLSPTTTVANKMPKLGTFRPGRKRGHQRRRPLKKLMPFYRNIIVKNGFATFFKDMLSSTTTEKTKKITEPYSLKLINLLSKFTSMDGITTKFQTPILGTTDLKGNNNFITTTQVLITNGTLENDHTTKPPIELSSEIIATPFLAFLNTSSPRTELSDAFSVTMGPIILKSAHTTRGTDKESFQNVELTAAPAPKTQMTKTSLLDKNELSTLTPTKAIYSVIEKPNKLAPQTWGIPLTETTLSPKWDKIPWKLQFSKITEISKPLVVDTLTVLNSPKSATHSTPLWRKNNSYIKNWSEKTIGKEATTINPKDLNSFYQTRLATPRITGGKFAAFTVLANSDAFIPCEASGNPQPTIHWSKIPAGIDTSKHKLDHRFEILPNGTLSILNVGIQDRGQYLCVATNQQGSDRLLVTLAVVTYPPRILGERSRIITVHSGKPVVMKCAAEGHPVPSLSWVLANKTYISEFSMENEAISVQAGGTLVIKRVSVYDRGIYTCTANNLVGSDTMVIRLQVIAAPPVILEEKKQFIIENMGESLKLPCTAKGNPLPIVHWVLFDGTEVKPLQYINGKLFLFPNGTLFIRNIVPSDSGNYECIATSSTGSERRVVLLQVEQRDIIPRIATTSQRLTQLNFGNKLHLNCSAMGQPKPRIIWRLPSKAVVDQWHRMGNRICVHSNGSLTIESVTEKDAGDYICVARNRMGDDLILLKVSVTMKPAKIDQKQYSKKLVPFGKDFRVDCKASGFPEPEISWSLPDGTVINNVMQADDSGHSSQRYTLFDNGTLYLNKVGISEEGDYTCYAQNTLGKDEMKVYIKVVAAAPHIKQNSKTNAKIKAGGAALLDCDAIGEPKPKIFWLLPSNDMIVASTQRYFLHVNGSLSITEVRLLDAGEYICVARNSGGDDTKLVKLDVVSKPPLINGLYSDKAVIKTAALKHSTKQIDCRAEGSPITQIMWIMPDNIFLTAPYYGSRITVHRNGTLEIRNIRSSDTAEFICVARNSGGESILVVHLEVLEILRRPAFKNPFNEKVIARPGETIFLNCSADGNPRPEIIWMLPNGRQLSTGLRTLQYYLGSNGTLIINSLSKADTGKYRCAAKNQVGYIEKLVILEVGQKPTIFIHSRGTIKRISGESLSLHCLAGGNPKPNIIWTLPNGFVLDRPQIIGKYTLLKNGTLFIRQTTINDRGSYICKAQNYIGDSTVVVFVMIVAYPPRITNRPPRNIQTMAGIAIQLH